MVHCVTVSNTETDEERRRKRAEARRRQRAAKKEREEKDGVSAEVMEQRRAQKASTHHRHRIRLKERLSQLETSDPLEHCRILATKRNGATKAMSRWRRRKKFHGILNGKPKVLCLGMIYPTTEPHTPPPQVEDVIELVRDHRIDQNDGRDFARLRAMELSLDAEAYAVSLGAGAPSRYCPKRHLSADFNTHDFLKGMEQNFGPVKFRQVILDYFYIPPAWTGEHWKPFFFDNVLPNLAQFLEFPPVDTPRSRLGVLGYGVIYLPFCLHCFWEVVASRYVLERRYTISFVPDDELEQHALWLGTQEIPLLTMQQILGKKRSQEREYCNVTTAQIQQRMDDPRVTTDVVMNLYNDIVDVSKVRMISMRPLPHINPALDTPNFLNVSVGGFVGLRSQANGGHT